MIKTHFSARGGQEKISGFLLPGDLFGLDGLGKAANLIKATALEDAILCEIKPQDLRARIADIAALRERLIESFGESSRRELALTAMLVQMTAEERVSTFLLELSDRLSARGYASSEFFLRMTRDDLGNYLGLKLETVSRVLARLGSLGCIAVRSRHVVIRNRSALQAIADGINRLGDVLASPLPGSPSAAG